MKFEKELDSCIEVLSHGASVTLLSLPSIGRRNYIEYLDEGIKEEGTFLWLYLDINDMFRHSILDFYKALLMGLGDLYKEVMAEKGDFSSIEESLMSDDPFAVFTKCKAVLRQILDESKGKVIVIKIKELSKLSDLDTSFFNSLKGLRDIDSARVAFYAIDTPVLSRDILPKAGDLSAILQTKTVWLPLPGEEIFSESIAHGERIFNCKMSTSQKDMIRDMTGGHAGLSKYAVLYMNDHPDAKDPINEGILEMSQISTRIQKILGVFSPHELQALYDLATDVDRSTIDKETLERLTKYEMVDKEGITIKLVEKYLSTSGLSKYGLEREATVTKKDKEKGRIQVKNGSAYIDGEMLETALSSREFKILKYFVENPNVLISRELLSEVLWGKNIEKYSDWAIDQAISRLRSKLKDNGYQPKHIKTLKGRGFRYEIR